MAQRKLELWPAGKKRPVGLAHPRAMRMLDSIADTRNFLERRTASLLRRVADRLD